ncbi:MAG: DsbA family protein, partial [Deltaproteobacteria bacterium]|nr:DsbA family protein [Deltaproteobacteria bacterium]
MTGRIERLRREYEIELRWVAFPLRPDTPEEGITIEKLFSDRGVNPVRIQTHLEQVAGEEGLPFGKREKTYNSRRAQELGKWAESMAMEAQFHDAVFRACLVEGRNISKISVLVDLAKSLGLPLNEAETVLETRAFKSAVDRDWMRSQAMRIRIVP